MHTWHHLGNRKEGLEWAKKARLAHMRKFDLNQVDKPMVKELIYSFHHVD